MTAPIGLRGHRIQSSERAAARRRDILLAAARVFAQQGYAATTLDGVAEQVGVSKGVIYYYFRSKEEIYTEIRATAIREAIERLEGIVAQGEPPELTLRAAITDLVSHIFDDLDRYANILRSGERLSPESRGQIRSAQRRYEHLLRGIVTDGVRAGVFVNLDPALMTFTMLRACLGVADWYSPGGRLTPEVIVEQVSSQVVSGVLQSPRRGAPLSSASS